MSAAEVASVITDIGGIITDFIGMGLNSAQASEAQGLTLQMFNQQLAAEKKQSDFDNSMSLKQFGLQEEAFDWQKGESRKDRREREEERQYGRREGQFNKAIDMVNQNQMMRNNYANLFQQKIEPKQQQFSGV